MQETNEFWYSGKLFKEEMATWAKNQDYKIEACVEKMKGLIKNAYDWQSNYIVQCPVELYQFAEKLIATTAGLTFTIQELSAIMAKSFGKDVPTEPAINVASWLICSCKGIIYELQRDEDNLLVISNVCFSDEEREMWKMQQYIPPMLSKPLEWNNNSDGGYSTIRKNIVLGGKLNHHKEYQSYDVINMLQEIVWELDPYIIDMDEEANKEEFESEKEEMQWNLYKDTSREIYKLYRDKKFHFIWRFDKRGRQYSSGYHINLQSTKYKKASLSFGEKELITGTL